MHAIEDELSPSIGAGPRRPGVSESLSFERVCAVADLPEVGAVAADVDGDVEVAIVRDRAVTSTPSTTPAAHANVSLSEGEVEDCTIECWLHGSRFDLRTGEPTGLPATTRSLSTPSEDRR